MPKIGDLRLLGIYMKNSPEWVIAEYAAYAYSGAVISLYDSLGADSTEFILNHTELTTVVCTPVELKKLLSVGGLASEALVSFVCLKHLFLHCGSPFS